MATRLSELVDALEELDADPGQRKMTSMRLPTRLCEAAMLATKLGMDESVTSAMSHALADRIRAFTRRRAIAEHFSRFPGDRPSLAAVVNRRVSGTPHPAADRPDLVEEVAGWFEQRNPEWPAAGRVDEVVELVVDCVEMLAAGIGSREEGATR